MNFFIFVLIYPIIWLLSKLPMSILYFISDFIYFVLYYIIGYRKKIVHNNLKLSFPVKSQKEILIIEKKSFRHFVDTFVEMIKSFTISESEISKRFVFTNPEILDNLHNKNKSIILMAGHYANWEWATLYISKVIKFESYGAYKKIKNKYFDKKIKQSRNRFGSHLVASKQFVKLIIKNANSNRLSLYGLLSDQSPKLHKTNYWSSFMGVKVPLQTGPEILSKKFNLPVIYLETEKVKRGYYKSTIHILAENPKDFKDFQITELFTKALENQIYNKPESYFWTHKRFKHASIK